MRVSGRKLTEAAADPSDGSVLLQQAGDGVRQIIINRPGRRNALDLATYVGLIDALEACGKDGATRIIVLSGAGGVFTSGNDIADFQNAPSEGPLPAIRFLKALAGCKKPIVAAVEGYAVGIGTTMLLHIDFVYAGHGAKFRLPFVPLGLSPEGASSLLLPRIAGSKRAAELLMFGEPFSADEAREAGLVTRVVEDGTALDLALDRARHLASLPEASILATKDLLQRASRTEIARVIELEGRIIVERRASPEAQAAFTAFLARK